MSRLLIGLVLFLVSSTTVGAEPVSYVLETPGVV
jgi:hypothetical protein